MNSSAGTGEYKTGRGVYLLVLCTSDGIRSCDIDRRFSAASAVMRLLYSAVVVKGAVPDGSLVLHPAPWLLTLINGQKSKIWCKCLK